ncbi:MAG: NUDIX hydrolase [Spirochaetia bacterium]|nr:NUDIX hydrolase [Spirochaetia bacterium]MCF7941675.1 NUDIX hydrolase [Spirochaetia bacterium]
MKHLSWDTTRREKIHDCKIFDVYEVDRTSYDGSRGTFIQIEAPDWVTVIPMTQDALGNQCFMMVRQYRHGNQAVTTEFPAGTVEPGEPPLQAALRELLEETGCRPATITKIGAVSPNPAFLTNTVTYYVAEGMEMIQAQELDEHEIIDVELVPVNEVLHSMGTGTYSNGIMVAAMAFYQRWRGLVADEES